LNEFSNSPALFLSKADKNVLSNSDEKEFNYD